MAMLRRGQTKRGEELVELIPSTGTRVYTLTDYNFMQRVIVVSICILQAVRLVVGRQIFVLETLVRILYSLLSENDHIIL